MSSSKNRTRIHLDTSHRPQLPRLAAALANLARIELIMVLHDALVTCTRSISTTREKKNEPARLVRRQHSPQLAAQYGFASMCASIRQSKWGEYVVPASVQK